MSAGAPAIHLGREQVEALRPAAEAFADAVRHGARGVARIERSGQVRFASEAVGEIHDELRAALGVALGGAAAEVIVARSGRPLDGFLDRLVAGWLRAEPSMGEFLRSDPRGHGGFLFDLLRAELGELGVAFSIEPGAEAERVEAPASRWRFVLPVVGGAWVGAGCGWMAELVGLAGATAIGFLLGLGLGLVVALIAGARRAAVYCSECGAPTERSFAACGRCGTRFVEPEIEPVEAEEPARK